MAMNILEEQRKFLFCFLRGRLEDFFSWRELVCGMGRADSVRESVCITDEAKSSSGVLFKSVLCIGNLTYTPGICCR